jgi:hypothetical protein
MMHFTNWRPHIAGVSPYKYHQEYPCCEHCLHEELHAFQAGKPGHQIPCGFCPKMKGEWVRDARPAPGHWGWLTIERRRPVVNVYWWVRHQVHYRLFPVVHRNCTCHGTGKLPRKPWEPKRPEQGRHADDCYYAGQDHPRRTCHGAIIECTACGPEDYGPCTCTDYCGSICCTVVTRPVHNHLYGKPAVDCPACEEEKS